MQGEAAVPSVKITVRPNGPFRVEGAIQLVDVDGNAWDLTGKPAISLCRCGLSSKRPILRWDPRGAKDGCAMRARSRRSPVALG